MLRVVYLVFNEGYSASSGDSLTRADLSGEAIRLGRLLVELLPEPEAIGLLALMLLHESRRAARTTPHGELVLLDEQDRTLVEARADRRRHRAGANARSASRRFGPYTLQAAIAAVHADAPTRRRHRLGARSSASTTCCCAPSPRRWSSSIARSRWRCATAPRPASR